MQKASSTRLKLLANVQSDTSPRNRDEFNRKIQNYRRLSGNSQTELAQALGLNPKVLSRKLNGLNNAFLTNEEIKEIVKTLAEWQAITRQAEAFELLELMDLRATSFSPEEWERSPLNRLEVMPPDKLTRDKTPNLLPLSLTFKNNISDLSQPDNTAANESNLPLFSPVQATSPDIYLYQSQDLIGREAEIELICERLKQRRTQLLTLTGPGGVGKTQLSLAVTARFLEEGRFPLRVAFVALTTVSDPKLLVSAIAQTLGVREVVGKTLVQNLKEYLSQGQLLLVLDNFEHLTDGAGLLPELLKAAPGLKILVTSREVLHLPGEYQFQVSPLAVPPINDNLNVVKFDHPEELLTYPAVKLFVTRIQEVKVDFELNPENAATIATLCRRLDGLPLALELAASAVKLFSPSALLKFFDGSNPARLKLLKRNSKAASPQHQTLRQSLVWSYDLLTEQEQALFTRLAIFSGGGGTLAAITEILAPVAPPGWNEETALEGLWSLVDKSMLRALEGLDGETRFIMLETIHEYASERLHEPEHSTEFERLKAEFGKYYLSLIQLAEPQLLGANPTRTLVQLEAEHPNFRAALQWAISESTGNSWEILLSLGSHLWRFWQLHSHLSEGRHWLEKCLAATANLEIEDDNANKKARFLTLRARVLHGAGLLAYYQGDYRQSTRWLSESLELCRKLDYREGIILALQHLGLTELYQENFTQAQNLLEEVLSLRQQTGDGRGIALTLNDLGNIQRFQANYTKASQLFEESLRSFQELNNREGLAIVYCSQGHLSYCQADFNQAKTSFEESLKIYYELGQTRGLVQNIEGLAATLVEMGESTKGLQLWEIGQMLKQLLGSVSDPQMYPKYHHRIKENDARPDQSGRPPQETGKLANNLSIKATLEYVFNEFLATK
jgi:predicted ATPase/transcriptional regulator with XRE-family HTH domain